MAWVDDDGRGDVTRMEPHPDIRPVILVPSDELSTAEARTMLPDSVSLRDATANIARTALLVHALTVDPARLMAATTDRIHQRSRATCYPASLDLVALLRESGVPAVISGAGPSVLAFADAMSAEAMAGIDTAEWIVREVPVSSSGAREVPLLPPA